MKKILISICLGALLIAGCGNPKAVPYFQDITADATLDAVNSSIIKIAPDDKLSIIVNSRDPQLTNLFNLPYISRILGSTSDYYSGSNGVAGYTVDAKGTIDFPVVGEIQVAGLSRGEVEEKIKAELTSRNLVKDPVVTVDFMNLRVSVMGEVAHPGRFAIDRDHYTLMDAISAAGDLTVFGQRENVKVLRMEGDTRKTYVVNLCSAEDVLKSPAYYLQQNDIVYVEPNKVRARQSTVNGNNVLSTSFWISIASLTLTLMTYLRQLK